MIQNNQQTSNNTVIITAGKTGENFIHPKNGVYAKKGGDLKDLANAAGDLVETMGGEGTG